MKLSFTPIAAGALLLITSAFNYPLPVKETATLEKNKAITRLFYNEVFNKHNIAMIDSIVSPDYIEHQTDVDYAANRKGLIKEFADYFKGFPDANITVHFMVAENDMVTTQFTITGTHQGKIYGIKPTGRKIKISGVDVIRYTNGKAVEHWGYLEEGKLLTQLGLIKKLRNKGGSE